MIKPLLPLLVVLTGCVPKDILKHYKVDVEATETDIALIESQFEPNIFVAPQEQRPTLLVDKLSSHGQLAYIKAISKNYTAEPDAVVRATSSAVASASKVCGWADLTSRQARVVVSLVGTQLRPADRFDDLQFSLQRTCSDCYEFVSWDKFETSYATVNLGTDSLTRQAKFGINRDTSDFDPNTPPTVTPDSSILKLFGESTTTRAEVATYVARVASINGVLSVGKAELYQVGAPYTDLTGNVLASLTLKVPADSARLIAFKFPALFPKGVAAVPETVAPEICTLSLPKDPAKSLQAKLLATGNLRLVKDGHDTYRESDDTISYVPYRKEYTQPVDLVSAGSLQYKLYALSNGSARLAWEEIRGSKGSVPVIFLSESEARDALSWFQNKVPGALSSRALVLLDNQGNVRPVKAADFAQLTVASIGVQDVDGMRAFLQTL